MSNTIAEQISQYNLYNANDKLVGITEVTLPSFEAMTNTVSGAGILGEYETTSPGQFSSSEIEIPFRVIDKTAAELLKTKGHLLFLRAAVQVKDQSTHQLLTKQLKVTIGGTPKGVTIGTGATAKAMDSSIKMEITYYKHVYDGSTLFELDKLNNVHVVNDEDQLADIKAII